MSDVAGIYDELRVEISELLRSLPVEELQKQVPATPEWSVKDVAAHLAGDATCVVAADFPTAFFQNFAAPDAVAELNEWTARQIRERKNHPLEDILAEWEKSAITLTSMMRGETPWPVEILFADRVLLTDITVHQHDLMGALGREPDKTAAPVKMAASGYIAMVDWRLRSDNAGCLKFEAGEKSWLAGGDEPDATVSASRWEFFRALSGRRSPEQVRAYDWSGDPEPFIDYFYPYGARADALIE